MIYMKNSFVYQDGDVKSLEDFLWEYRHILQPQDIGLKKVEHFENCYAMFHDFSDRSGSIPRNFRGIKLDIAGRVVVSQIPKDMVAIGLLKFNL